MRKHSAKDAAKALGDVPTQLAALTTMTVGDLLERYREVVGEPTRTRNGDYLRKKLAWAIQAKAEGGLTERSLAKVVELGDQLPDRWLRRQVAEVTPFPPKPQPTRDFRLPPVGTVLTRRHGGRKHSVTVLDEGFQHAGETFRSLSAVAKRITGQQWNGFAFFDLNLKSEAA